MPDYDDLFEFEDESIRLDFKGVPYSREKHADLLKDIIAFANADYEGDRFIIVGIVKDEKNEKVFWGVNKEDIVDSAVYYQLVRENVEPDINFDYFPYPYAGKDFAIFRIFDCLNKPYLMKKEYSPLRQGDGWIRKGTHQPRLNRRDLDSINDKKQTLQRFSGDVRCYFSDSGTIETEILSTGEIRFPSDLEAERISKLIEEKKEYVEMINSDKNITFSFAEAMTPLVSPYGKFYSINGLESDLENVKKEYFDDDRYTLFEQHGNFINISILNLGDRYIEDASLRVIFPKIEGLEIAEKIYTPSKRTSGGMRSFEQTLVNIGYPRVEYLDDVIVVKKYLENIKHQIPINEVFSESIRIIVQKNLEGNSIPVKCIIYGKNLQKPIEKELIIHVKAEV